MGGERAHKRERLGSLTKHGKWREERYGHKNDRQEAKAGNEWQRGEGREGHKGENERPRTKHTTEADRT